MVADIRNRGSTKFMAKIMVTLATFSYKADHGFNRGAHLSGGLLSTFSFPQRYFIRATAEDGLQFTRANIFSASSVLFKSVLFNSVLLSCVL